MSRVVFDVPDRTLLALKLTQEAMGRELLLAAAIKLFEVGRLSSGAAAELAGVPKPLFLTRLADFGVATFDLTEEQLDRETPLA